MTDNTENLVLEHLRAIRSEIKEIKTEMRDRLSSIDSRLHALETQVVGLHATNAEFRGRLERIENRLELQNA